MLPAIWMIYKHLEELRGTFTQYGESSKETVKVKDKILSLFKTRLLSCGTV